MAKRFGKTPRSYEVLQVLDGLGKKDTISQLKGFNSFKKRYVLLKRRVSGTFLTYALHVKRAPKSTSSSRSRVAADHGSAVLRTGVPSTPRSITQ